MSSDVERLIQLAEKRKEFFHLEDGYVYYEQSGNGGLSAWILWALTDELDKRNKEWDDIIKNDPRIG